MPNLKEKYTNELRAPLQEKLGKKIRLYKSDSKEIK